MVTQYVHSSGHHPIFRFLIRNSVEPNSVEVMMLVLRKDTYIATMVLGSIPFLMRLATLIEFLFLMHSRTYRVSFGLSIPSRRRDVRAASEVEHHERMKERISAWRAGRVAIEGGAKRRPRGERTTEGSEW